MPSVRPLLRGISNRLDRFIGPRWGEAFPIWYVCAYPKSGSTWLSQMVADYLDIPFPQFSLMPMACQCVIQNHWLHHPRLRRVFYLYRDGRDVTVSHYFFLLRRIRRNPRGKFERRLAGRFDHAFGAGYDPDDVAANLPRFIELDMDRPVSRFVRSWPEHVQQWYDPSRKHIAFLSYESLRSDPLSTLKKALEQFIDEPVDETRLRQSIDRYDFKRVSGREAGSEDRKAFTRKGVAGDWINHFTREAAEVFDHFAGQTLIELGYESDHSWIERTPAPDSGS